MVRSLILVVGSLGMLQGLEMSDVKIKLMRYVKVSLILLGTFQLYSWLSNWYFFEAKREVSITYSSFYHALHERNLDKAYGYMCQSYRDENGLAGFKGTYQDRGYQWLALDNNSIVSVGWLRHTATVCPNYDGWMVRGPCYEFVRFADRWCPTGEATWSLD